MALRHPSSWLASLTLLTLLSILVPTNALYFYMDGRQSKCFYEDLPKDTLVAGKEITTTQPNQPNTTPAGNQILIS